MGQYIHYVGSGPQCTKEDLQNLEKNIKATLPKEYASYLLQYNGAQPVIVGREDDGSIIVVTSLESRTKTGILFNNFLRIKEHDSEIPTILDTFNDFKESLPPHTIPIARDPGSGFFLIVTEGPDTGNILFWGLLRQESNSTRVVGRQLALAGTTFAAFISALQPAPQDWDQWEQENLSSK